jgi:hypothetical protein
MTKQEIKEQILNLAAGFNNVLVVFNSGHVKVGTFDRDVGSENPEILIEKDFKGDYLACLSYMYSRC